MIRQVEYFEKPGRENTSRCLEIVSGLVNEGFSHLVVATTAGTEWCQTPHFQYQVSGRLHVVMEDDGAAFDLGPGDVSFLPARHDAWVIGEDSVVLVDWYGAGNYAEGQRDQAS